MTHFYRNGNRVEVSSNGEVAFEMLPNGHRRRIVNPKIDLLTGQVYETGEEYVFAQRLAEAARTSVTVTDVNEMGYLP